MWGEGGGIWRIDLKKSLTPQSLMNFLCECLKDKNPEKLQDFECLYYEVSEGRRHFIKAFYMKFWIKNLWSISIALLGQLKLVCGDEA